MLRRASGSPRPLSSRLAFPPLWEGERGAQFANLVVSANAEPGSPIHFAFVADSRDQVDAFHRSGIEAGYQDNGGPAVREQYSSAEAGRYHAAFLLDSRWIDQNIDQLACAPACSMSQPTSSRPIRESTHVGGCRLWLEDPRTCIAELGDFAAPRSVARSSLSGVLTQTARRKGSVRLGSTAQG